MIRCTFLFLILLPCFSYAQVVVENGTELQNAINEASAGDVIQLRRGRSFIINNTLQPSAPITIEATGNGDRPRIIPISGEGGVSHNRPFQVNVNLTVRGLYITNMSPLRALETRVFRIGAEDVSLHIEDCEIVGDAQTAFRVEGNNSRIYINNSVFYDIGPDSINDNGRIIDYRETSPDSLIIRNSTFYNVSQRLTRMATGRIVNYVEIVNNTFNFMGLRVLDLPIVRELYMINNQMMNVGYIAQDTVLDDASILSIDSLHADSSPDQFAVSHNNYFMDPQLLVDGPSIPNGETTPNPGARSFFNSNVREIVERNGAQHSMTTEAVAFANGPAGIWDFESTSSLYYENDEFGLPYYPSTEVDFAYVNSPASETAAYDGKALGSLFWYDDEPMTLVDIENVSMQEMGSGSVDATAFYRVTYVVFDGTFSGLSAPFDRAEITVNVPGSEAFVLGEVQVNVDTPDSLSGSFPTNESRFTVRNIQELNAGHYQLNIYAQGVESPEISVQLSANIAVANEPSPILPGKQTLITNFPNPFNPSTTIKFSLSQPLAVELEVFTLTGQLVASLLQQRLPAGEHFVPFDASQLPSGVYLSRLKAGNQISYSKMTLVK